MQSRNSNDSAKYYFNEGRKLREQGKYDDAIAQLSNAIALDKDNATAYHERGFTYRQLGKDAEAIADYTKAIELNPNKSIMHNNRSLAYTMLGKLTEATADSNQAIQLDPTDSSAYSNRGFTYNRQGKYTQAITDYTTAILLDPHDSYPYNNRGCTYHRQGKYTQAIQDFKEALAINPNFAEAKNNLKAAEKAQSEHKLTLLSQRAKDTFMQLSQNGKPPSDMPEALLNMMTLENKLLDALLEHIKKSNELDADAARSITAAINQWRHYPLAACVQPLKDLASLTPPVLDYLRRKEMINRYIAKIRLALFEIKNEANRSNWKIKHWLSGEPIVGTPRHIRQIRNLLSSINEYSSIEAVMTAYKKMISLLPTTSKKSRLPDTVAFYDEAAFYLNNIMFNPPVADAPPSYAEHMKLEQKQLAVLGERFPKYTIYIAPDAYILQDATPCHITINKLQFNEDLAEKSRFVEMRPAHLPSLAASTAIAQTPAVTAPIISSSSSSFFAGKPVAASAADAATVDAADELKSKFPAVPTHLVSEPVQRQRMYA